MTEPNIELPADDDAPPNPWEPVNDHDGSEGQTPVEVEQEEVPDPFEPVADSTLDDVSLPEVQLEEVLNPWDNVAPEEAVPPLPARQLRALLPSPPVARLLTAPGDDLGPPQPIPWRTSAEVSSPTPGRLLCEADPRLAHSRLLVAAWEWLPEGEDHVRFRLADDGEDVIVRVTVTGQPTVRVSMQITGHEIEAELMLVVDREVRGLVLGRDLLAGRFLIDPAREDWG